MRTLLGPQCAYVKAFMRGVTKKHGVEAVCKAAGVSERQVYLWSTAGLSVDMPRYRVEKVIKQLGYLTIHVIPFVEGRVVVTARWKDARTGERRQYPTKTRTYVISEHWKSRYARYFPFPEELRSV